MHQWNSKTQYDKLTSVGRAIQTFVPIWNMGPDTKAKPAHSQREYLFIVSSWNVKDIDYQ